MTVPENLVAVSEFMAIQMIGLGILILLSAVAWVSYKEIEDKETNKYMIGVLIAIGLILIGLGGWRATQIDIVSDQAVYMKLNGARENSAECQEALVINQFPKGEEANFTKNEELCGDICNEWKSLEIERVTIKAGVKANSVYEACLAGEPDWIMDKEDKN